LICTTYLRVDESGVDEDPFLADSDMEETDFLSIDQNKNQRLDDFSQNSTQPKIVKEDNRSKIKVQFT
jgi:hypothetical protein